MKIHTNLDNFSVNRPVVTIGTFDGIHLGHMKVIDALKEIAEKTKGESVIFTFYPHPRLVLNPDEKNLRLINTIEEKKILLAETGIDHLVIFPFTIEFSKLSYQQFVSEILIGKMKMKHLVVGYDHKFGNNREGNFTDLLSMAKTLDFSIEKIKALNVKSDNISSTKIRKALADGDIQKANKYLGYKYFIKGTVVLGQKLGRTLGFPTANIDAHESYKLLPKDGVYAVKVLVNDNNYEGMLNIGLRPTVNNQLDNRTIEVNIFNFSEDIYYKDISVILYDRLRDEKCFDGLEGLIVQLNQDRVDIKNYFSDLKSDISNS